MVFLSEGVFGFEYKRDSVTVILDTIEITKLIDYMFKKIDRY